MALGGFLLLMLVGLNLRPFLTSVGPVLTAVQADTGMGQGVAAVLTALPFMLMGLLAWGFWLWLAPREAGHTGASVPLRGFLGSRRAWLLALYFGLGGCFSLCLIVSLDHLPGARAAGALAAFVQGIGFLITAVGPWLVGALRDGGGDFVDAWWLHGAIALCMLLLSACFNPAGYERSMARLGT